MVKEVSVTSSSPTAALDVMPDIAPSGGCCCCWGIQSTVLDGSTAPPVPIWFLPFHEEFDDDLGVSLFPPLS